MYDDAAFVCFSHLKHTKNKKTLKKFSRYFEVIKSDEQYHKAISFYTVHLMEKSHKYRHTPYYNVLYTLLLYLGLQYILRRISEVPQIQMWSVLRYGLCLRDNGSCTVSIGICCGVNGQWAEMLRWRRGTDSHLRLSGFLGSFHSQGDGKPAIGTPA